MNLTLSCIHSISWGHISLHCHPLVSKSNLVLGTFLGLWHRLTDAVSERRFWFWSWYNDAIKSGNRTVTTGFFWYAVPNISCNHKLPVSRFSFCVSLN